MGLEAPARIELFLPPVRCPEHGPAGNTVPPAVKERQPTALGRLMPVSAV